NRVVRTVKQFYFYVQYREASQRTFVHHQAEAFFNGRPEFFRHVTAHNGGLERKASARLGRTDAVVDLTVLTRTTRLLLVGVAVFDGVGNGCAVSHLRQANDQFHTVSALQNVDFNIQVQFAHAFQDGLTRLFIGFNREGRIFSHHLTDGDTHLVDHALVFRLHGDGDYRLREHHGFQSTGVFRITQGVTGLYVLHAHNGDDVTRLSKIQLSALVSVHFTHTTDTFSLTGEAVQNGVAFTQFA